MKQKLRICYLSIAALFTSLFLSAQELNSDELLSLSLEELLNREVVTVSKFKQNATDAPGVITVISAEEIARFGANNLLEALERVPSLTFLSTYLVPDNTISIRGDVSTHYNRHVLILINGRPGRETLFGGLDVAIFKSLPLDAIDRVEIIRGPGSVLYGSNAYTGVVNIITNSKKENSTTVSTGVGSFETFHTSVTSRQSSEDFSMTTSLNVFKEEGWENSGIDENGDAFSLKMGETNLGGLLSGKYKNFHFTSFIGYTAQNHFGKLPRVVFPGPTGPARAFRGRQLQTSRTFTNIGYDFKHSDNWTTEVNATANLMTSRWVVPIGNFKAESKDLIIEATNYLSINESFNWVAGSYAYFQSGDAEINDDPTVGIPQYAETWYSVYSQFDYSPIYNLKLIAGGQYNKVEGIDGTFVPRLGIIYKYQNFGTKLLYGQAFRAPFEFENGLNDPSVLAGNPNLSPEVISTLDAQLFYNTKRYQVALTYFNSSQEDLISRTAPPNPTYINLGQLDANGIELETKLNIADKCYVTGSYTIQQNTLNDSITNATKLPESALKLGVAFNFFKNSSIGIFNTSFTDFTSIANENPAVQLVNPEPLGFNLLTANLRLDLLRLFGTDSDKELFVNVYAYNLLNEDIYYPEYVRGNINSIKARGGQAFYVKLMYTF